MGNSNLPKKDQTNKLKSKHLRDLNINHIQETDSLTKLSQTLKTEDKKQITSSLSNHFFFKSLSIHDKEDFITNTFLYSIEPNTYLIRENTIGDYLFIIKEGSFQLEKSKKLIKILEVGEFIGDMDIILNANHSYSAVSITRSVLYLIDIYKLNPLIERVNKSNQDECFTFLNSLRLLKNIEYEQKVYMATLLNKFEFEKDFTVYREDEKANGLFFIKEGDVEIVDKDRSVIRIMRKNEYFGEAGLILGLNRTKTVITKTDCIIYAISNNGLQHLFRTEKIKDLLIQSSLKVIMLSSEIYKRLNSTLFDKAIEVFEVKYYKKGEVVLKEDYLIKTKIIICLQGRLVSKQTGEVICEKGGIMLEKEVFRLDSSVIGKTVIADPDCITCEAKTEEIIRIIGYTFKDSLSKSVLIQQIKVIPFFKSLTNKKLEMIIGKIKIEHFNDKESIINQGEEGSKLYIIKHGKVDIYKDKIHIKTLDENSYFGERGLFFKEPRSASVIANGFVELLSLENEEFKILLETNLKEFIINRLIIQDIQVSLSDLEVIKIIHESGISRVLLVKNNKTKYIYALKQISKEGILQEKVFESIKTESDLIKKLDHPFILSFVKLLKDSSHVYFLLEYAKGKSLDEVCNDIGLLNKQQTQFFTACLMVVIEYLHDKSIIYRDVRPENVIVLENGYIKLLDYSTIKQITDRTYTIIGNPYYMSPELILGDGYSFEFDFWSIACCAYEFHCGAIPFGDNAENPVQIFNSIINQDLRFPKFVKDNDFVSIIRVMLFKNIKKRLYKLSHIKSHPYFSNFNWDGLTDLTFEPSYKIKTEPVNTKEVVNIGQFNMNNPFNYKVSTRFDRRGNDEEYNNKFETWFNNI